MRKGAVQPDPTIIGEVAARRSSACPIRPGCSPSAPCACGLWPRACEIGAYLRLPAAIVTELAVPHPGRPA